MQPWPVVWLRRRYLCCSIAHSACHQIFNPLRNAGGHNWVLVRTQSHINIYTFCSCLDHLLFLLLHSDIYWLFRSAMRILNHWKWTKGLNPLSTYLNQLCSDRCTPLTVHSALVCGGCRRSWVCFFRQSPNLNVLAYFSSTGKKKYFGKWYLDTALNNLI